MLAMIYVPYLADSHTLLLTTFFIYDVYSTRHHSQGIAAAVRNKGGRFLAYDAHNQIFCADIGDKKATEKTSQALRDVKRKIVPVGILTPQVNKAKQLSKDLYSSYSEQVLQSLHHQDGCHSQIFPTVTDVVRFNLREGYCNIFNFDCGKNQ